MHIVYISREYVPTQRGGGIASYVREMAVAMTQRGHRVTVICASDDTRCQSDSIEDGIRVIRLRGGDFIIPSVEYTPLLQLKKLRMMYRFYSYRRRILNTVRQLENVDIIEVPDYGAEGYFLAHLDIPVVVRLHAPSITDRSTGGILHYPISKFYLNWCARKEIQALVNFTHFSACSYSMKEWYSHCFPQIKGQWTVIYNPLNTEQWIDTTPCQYTPNTILYVGTVVEVKGVGQLVEACRQLHDEGIPVQLTIAGKIGSYAEQLQHEVSNRHLTDWCHFMGHLTREQLIPLYRSSMVTCLPSYWENMPLVCLEAMAMGNVVIGSNSGGMAEIITDHEDGYLVTPKDVKGIKEAIANALRMAPSEVETMRGKARHAVESRFSARNLIPQMEHYYQQLCNK